MSALHRKTPVLVSANRAWPWRCWCAPAGTRARGRQPATRPGRRAEGGPAPLAEIFWARSATRCSTGSWIWSRSALACRTRASGRRAGSARACRSPARSSLLCLALDEFGVPRRRASPPSPAPTAKTTTTALTAAGGSRSASTRSPPATSARRRWTPDGAPGRRRSRCLTAHGCWNSPSFQIQRPRGASDAEAATVVNVTDDHLDRYADLPGQYAATKAAIFQGEGVQVLAPRMMRGGSPWRCPACARSASASAPASRRLRSG